MGHTNSVLMAISKCPNPTVFQKTLSVNDFYFGSKDFEYPMGHISFVGKLDAITLRAGAPAIAPGFTLELMAKHSLDFWLTSEDLPDPNNRVTINRDGEIVLTYTPNNLKAHEQLKAHLQRAMKQNTCSIHGHECHQGLFARSSICRPKNSTRGSCAPEWHNPLRQGSEDFRPGCELQSARGRQSLRCGREFLPLERRRQSGADHHSECSTGR